MPTATEPPIFHLDGGRYVASDLARGPWDPRACHGGAPAALLAAAIDRVPAPVAMQGVRLTFDLLRPVPVGTPLRLDVEVIREGRRVQLVDARLTQADDGPELVRCRALRIRSTSLELPTGRPMAAEATAPPPESLPRVSGVPGVEGEGFWTAVDVRLVDGELGRPGIGRGWFRVVAPLTDGLDERPAATTSLTPDPSAWGAAGSPSPNGRWSVGGALPLTPLARVAATGDFGNGIGAPLAMGPFRYLNPDLTVDVHRLPVDEWVSLESRSVAQPAGVGLTTGTLGDREGALGTCLQSLFIDAA
ncbi:MAG: thioesterase family protein [Nitriliruptoraceae bacterium]